MVLQEKLVIETTYTQFGYHRLGIKYRLSLLGMSVAPLIYLNNRIPMTVPHLQVRHNLTSTSPSSMPAYSLVRMPLLTRILTLSFVSRIPFQYLLRIQLHIYYPNHHLSLPMVSPLPTRVENQDNHYHRHFPSKTTNMRFSLLCSSIAILVNLYRTTPSKAE